MNQEVYRKMIDQIPGHVQLIAVSKTKPESEVMEAYQLGQRHFGENWAQELKTKHEHLPEDICWHFIGHLQTNKIKYIIQYVHLIHSIDSFRLLQEVNRLAAMHQRTVGCLLQFHIATEETKFGFSDAGEPGISKSPKYRNPWSDGHGQSYRRYSPGSSRISHFTPIF